MNDTSEIERLKTAHAEEIRKIKSDYRIRRIYRALTLFVFLSWGVISVMGLGFSLFQRAYYADSSVSIWTVIIAALSCCVCSILSHFVSGDFEK